MKKKKGNGATADERQVRKHCCTIRTAARMSRHMVLVMPLQAGVPSLVFRQRCKRYELHKKKKVSFFSLIARLIGLRAGKKCEK